MLCPVPHRAGGNEFHIDLQPLHGLRVVDVDFFSPARVPGRPSARRGPPPARLQARVRRRAAQLRLAAKVEAGPRAAVAPRPPAPSASRRGGRRGRRGRRGRHRHAAAAAGAPAPPLPYCCAPPPPCCCCPSRAAAAAAVLHSLHRGRGEGGARSRRGLRAAAASVASRFLLRFLLPPPRDAAATHVHRACASWALRDAGCSSVFPRRRCCCCC